MKNLERLLAWLVVAAGLAVAQQPAASGNTKAVGTVQSVSGNTITLKSDAGAEITVTALEGTRILRSEPGQKSLKEATPIQLSEVQSGDRALASGQASADGKSMTATTIVLMKRSDIASKQEKERQDWQHRGVGGLVHSVDASAGAVRLSTMSMGQKKEITVHVSPSTVIRRYAPDSVKFDDARKSTLGEIKAGDQLRARGQKNAEGTEITAEEIVSGSFRNVAGTVQFVDKAKNEVTVMDLATKKPVTVAVAADSQMRKLPEMIAQHIAQRLKGGGAASGQPGQAPPSTPGATPSDPPREGFGGGGMRGNGGGDMLQMVLSRAPVVQLADLQKGDAVMMVATEGSVQSAPEVITLLSGVEPILSASPKGGDTSTILSPWNLGGGGGGDLGQ